MNQPNTIELGALLDNLQPITVLDRLGAGEVPPALGLYRARALLDLDRFQEAREQAKPLELHLTGDDLARASTLWAALYLEHRAVDGAAMSAQHAARVAETDLVRARALSISALGYAGKQCWNLAETTLRQAVELAPNDPRVITAQAIFRLEADQRLEARAIYERLCTLDSVWAQANADYGLGRARLCAFCAGRAGGRLGRPANLLEPGRAAPAPQGSL